MSRIIFWFVLALLAWFGLKNLGANRRSDELRPQAKTEKGPALMRQCAYCGVHYPDRDGVVGPDGRDFCGAAHLDAAVHARER